MRDTNRIPHELPVEAVPSPPMQHPIGAYVSITLVVFTLAGVVGWKIARQAKDVREAEHAAATHVVAPSSPAAPPLAPAAPPAATSIASTTGAEVPAPVVAPAAVVASPAPPAVPPQRAAPHAHAHRAMPRAQPAPIATSTSDNPYDAP